ncbi:MAG: hypothetical protein M1832_000261 [Thelocarpon impressellum]|nr:MAG: hypothetical protein M1832_000261 [Thelocarpon impressellum]
MSLLQNEDFTIYHLRTSYLSLIKDGVGDRLISVNPSVFNAPGFRSAGWQPNAADIKRTYSPPIPTAIASDYFQAPPRSAGLPPPGFGDDDDEGGLVTGGGGSGDTLGPGLQARRRRRREQMEEEDSSDLSDESDDADGNQRAAQQIRFVKMPVRTRSGSSPIRGSNVRDGPASSMTSPMRRAGESRLRRGSLGAVEAMKQRARRDTTTSSDLSSENEVDPSMARRKHINPASAARATRALADNMQAVSRQATKESTDLEEEDSADGSAGTALSSEFAETADSPSFLNGVTNSLASLPLDHIASPDTPQRPGPKRSTPAPTHLQALPPPRPISVMQPVSALSLAINAKRSKAASPFDRFATLSGKGDPNPLHLKIYAPFSAKPAQPIEVPIRRAVRDDANVDRKVSVVDAIGLSLWRYSEENIAPPFTGEQMNVNRWTLRMVEDEEVDYDFPALERIKPLNDFTSNNNRAARARSNAKVYDEFALVEATDEQCRDNERLTPNPAPEPKVQEEAEDLTPQPSPGPASVPVPAPRRNPVLGPSYPSPALRHTPAAPVDAPATSTSHATPRTGPSKIIKVHLTSPEGYPQLVALDITTDTYLAEVFDIVCKKRNLDKAHHILKVTGTNVIAPLDRIVESLGEHSDIDLVRRRFGNDGPMALTGSPGSTPPNAPLVVTDRRKGLRKGTQMLHPLTHKEDALGSSANYKKYTVWRKQPMSFMPTHERILAIDGEYLHVMPGETGKSTIFDSGAKTTTIHFSSIIGCKSSRKHPSNFTVVVLKAKESKRYDFEAQNAAEAAEIVEDIKKRVEPFSER